MSVPATACSMISRSWLSVGSGAGWQPPSRYPINASTASPRAVASWASVRPPCGMPIISGSGRRSARSNDMSPVRYASAGSRGGISAASYRLTTFADRARWMRAAADVLDADREDTARLMTTEMGKTLAAARAEVQKCAKGCRYYADHAEMMLADEPVTASDVGASK